jgi:endonuclease YncB( thermonuclease family)
MTVPPYTYRANVIAVHDGDSIRLDVDAGFHITVDVTCRLNGVNARELAEPGGREARDHLAQLCPVGSETLFRSLGPDKYGRWLGVLTLADGRDVATTMIRDGYAAPWDGRGPKPLPPWPLEST